MIFSDLLKALGHESSISDFEVLGITSDSRRIQPGWIFVAIEGSSADGHSFLLRALESGAQALVVQHSITEPRTKNRQLVVPNTRRFLDQALHVFYGEPSLDLVCVGVTGTNGKTSVTHMIEAVLNGAGLPTAVMGTIDHHLGARRFPTEVTTPGPELLHSRLREFVKEGAKALVMEVSSHALDQHRSDSVSFDAVVFTNLTRDHLDYHKTMEGYFQSKQRLFDDVLWMSRKKPRVAIINHDDEYGRRLRVAPGCDRLTYGQSSSDITFKILCQDFTGQEIAVFSEGRRYLLPTPLVGLFNAYNLIAAFAASKALGVNLTAAAESLSRYSGVKGRLERVGNSKGLHIFVDYAHTDDALQNVLTTLFELRKAVSAQARVITVFGCGGDRDRGKRPLMARVAEEYSDQVILTSDNPRTEDPSKILAEIKEGFSAQYLVKNVISEVDRRKAIQIALQDARPGDVVLVAGKGHEDYQILGTEKRHFSDVEVIQEVLA